MMNPERGDAVFLSDVHLGAFSPQKNALIEDHAAALISFCREKGLKLHILGDLFDYWMEYPGNWPDYGNKILSELEKLAAQQPVLYITGNHDNWTGPRLESTGVDLEPEYRSVEFDGQKTLLLHGDGLTEPEMELPRPLFHRVLRNPYFIRVYQTVLPPAVGIGLMRGFSRFSKLRDQGEATDTSKIDNWAVRRLDQLGYDVIICGHHHNPRFIRTTSGLYINLGNFYRDRTVGLHTKGEWKLVTFTPEKTGFEPFKF